MNKDDKERYVFRLYNMYIPRVDRQLDYYKLIPDNRFSEPLEHANYLDRYKGLASKGKVNYTSPYMEGIYTSTFASPDAPDAPAKYTDVYAEQKEHSTHKKRPDYLLTRQNNTKEVLPHKGISVIGLADPKYSLYSMDNILDTPAKWAVNKDGTYDLIINNNIYDALKGRPKTGEESQSTDAVEEYMYGTGLEGAPFFDIMNKARQLGYEPNDDDKIILSHNNFSKDELQKAYKAIKNMHKVFLNNPKYINYLFGGVRGDGSYYDYGYKPSYYNLLKRILETTRGSGANTLALVSAPESAFYTVDDIIDKDIRGQRDYPEELIVKRLTPIRLYSTTHKNTLPDPKDYTYDNGEINLDAYLKALNDRQPTYDDVHQAQKPSYIIKDISDFVKSTKSDMFNFDEREKYAKDFITRNFEIDPDDIISDEEYKKIIWPDFKKSWLDLKAKQERQQHINNVLSDRRY